MTTATAAKPPQGSLRQIQPTHSYWTIGSTSCHHSIYSTRSLTQEDLRTQKECHSRHYEFHTVLSAYPTRSPLHDQLLDTSSGPVSSQQKGLATTATTCLTFQSRPDGCVVACSKIRIMVLMSCMFRMHVLLPCPEQGIKLLGLLLTGSTGQRMASRNGLA